MMGPQGPVRWSCRATQDHATHVREHAALLTPALDPKLVELIEKHRVKRIPIVRDEKIVGIVSPDPFVPATAAAQIEASGGQVTTDAPVLLIDQRVVTP